MESEKEQKEQQVGVMDHLESWSISGSEEKTAEVGKYLFCTYFNEFVQ